MSLFEKIIIPLIGEDIKTIDLTSSAGFIDSFISDPDNPSGEKELFLVYNDTIRNEFTIDRARRFETFSSIKRKYIKYVNGVPYYIYSFWVKPDIKKLYNGVITLSTAQKTKILQFWTIFDSVVDKVMANSVLVLDVSHQMPLSDYCEDMFDDVSFTVNKKGTVSNEIAPFIFVPS